MSASGPEQARIVVVGGGIIGLGVAWEAIRRGHDAVVLERHRVGSGAAGVAAGMLAPASEAETEDPDLLQLALESCRLYPDFVARVEATSGLSCGYRTEGTLLVALHRDHVEELERLAAVQQELGIETRPLRAGELLAHEPNLAPRAVGGLLAPFDRQVDPRQLMRALAAAVRDSGGRIEEGDRVDSLRVQGGRVVGVDMRLDGQPRFLAADAVVVAAGAWASRVLNGLTSLPLRPVKGQILRLRGAPPLRHVIRTADVYLVPRLDGELVVGATAEERGFDERPTAGAVMDLLREAWRVLPWVYELELAELGVGFRPALRDNLPVIGPGPVPGLFLAVGHYRHGVMLAPATARYLVDVITGGRLPPLLQPFQLSRLGGEPRETGVATR